MAQGAGPLDPTQPPATSQGATKEKARAPEPLVLQAILRSAGGSRAVINGDTLKVGELRNGVRLVAIYPRAVQIEREGQRAELRLVEPVIKPSQ